MTANDPARLELDRAVVAGAFPRLALESFEPVGGGWTSATYLVDGEWIVQVPVSDRAEERLLLQMEILPELAHDVSGAVPVPELASTDPVAMGYRRIDGVSFTEVGEEGVWPERLGRFLYDLHMVPPEFVGMRAVTPEQVREEQRAEFARLEAKVFPLLDEGERAHFAARFDGYLDDDAQLAVRAVRDARRPRPRPHPGDAHREPRRRDRLGGGRDGRPGRRLRLDAARGAGTG